MKITDEWSDVPITKSAVFMVSKDEWDTKEGPGKSMKNPLHVQHSYIENINWQNFAYWVTTLACACDIKLYRHANHLRTISLMLDTLITVTICSNSKIS